MRNKAWFVDYTECLSQLIDVSSVFSGDAAQFRLIYRNAKVSYLAKKHEGYDSMIYLYEINKEKGQQSQTK